jgi:hypothetical protein
MTSIDLGWPAFSSLVVISVLCGIGILIVFRRWSDQRAIQRSRSLIVAYLLEFRLFMNEPRLVLRAQRNLFRENLRLIRLLLRPALIVTVPMLILFEPMDALYRHAPLRVGEPAIVTIRSDRPLDPQLHAPDGILVETPPVHIPGEHQVSWRIRAVRPVSARLEIVWRDRVLPKRIAAGAGGLHFLFTRSRYLFDKDLDWLEIRYPVATVLRLHWLVWFCVLSTATILLLNTRSNRFIPGKE